MASSKKSQAKKPAAAEDEGMDPTQYFDNRLAALAAQKGAGVNPYPHKFEAKSSIPEYVKRYESLNDGDHLEDVEERIAGRIMNKRSSSQKLFFYDLHGGGAKVQVMADASAADINPIGSISKQDLRRFLRWAAVDLGFSSLAEVEAAPPTAELEPIRSNYSQLDEVDMGMTYEELSVYGRLRKIFRCGPVSMFKNLCYKWGTKLTPSEISDKVKHFFKYYSINRHKMTVLTPSYHAESYSPEDNRFDLRQFLYNSRWPYQFRKIDELVEQLDGDRVAITKPSAEDGGMGVIAAGSGNPSAGF